MTPTHTTDPSGLLAGHPALAMPAARPSRAAVIAVLGALLLLFAATRPMLHTAFVVDDLLPALMPRALVDNDTAPVPRTTLGGDTPIPAAAAAPPAAQPLLDALGEHHGDDGVSLAALGVALLDAHALVAARPLPSQGHLVALRVGLAALALLLAFAVLSALWGLARRLAPPDRVQLAAQLGFGGALTLVFGLASLAALFDAVTATQLVASGTLAAFAGAAAVFVAALVRVRARELLPVGALAMAMLLGTAALIGLGATL